MPTATAAPPRPALCPPLHFRLRSRVDTATEKLALRAALVAAHLLGLAAGRFLRELRSRNDPLVEMMALFKEAELRASVAWDIVDILGARLDKIPDRHRPYYSPAHRFRILEIKNFLGWNRELAARLFRICPNTLSNWEKHADPESKTVGSTVSSIPPSPVSPTSGGASSSPCSDAVSAARISWPKSSVAPVGRSPPAPSVGLDGSGNGRTPSSRPLTSVAGRRDP